jgi:hypothetical protein
MILENLSTEDRRICEQIWSCRTQQDLAQYFHSLQPQQQSRARVIMHLMVIETIDSQCWSAAHCELAHHLLRNYQL